MKDAEKFIIFSKNNTFFKSKLFIINNLHFLRYQLTIDTTEIKTVKNIFSFYIKIQF